GDQFLQFVKRRIIGLSDEIQKRGQKPPARQGTHPPGAVDHLADNEVLSIEGWLVAVGVRDLPARDETFAVQTLERGADRVDGDPPTRSNRPVRLNDVRLSGPPKVLQDRAL